MKNGKTCLTLLLAVCLMLLLAACGGQKGVYSGLVVASGGDPMMFELQQKNGKNYGFVVDENTQLVWQDKSAFSMWEEAGTDYDEWDVFSCDMQVTVEAGAATESADKYVDDCVEGWYMAEKVTVTGVEEDYFAVTAKPVIYLYPEQEEAVEVALDYDGDLTCTYPKYDGAWRVTARPDGTLTDAAGQQYNYLYWEGIDRGEYDFSQGFCVPGADTAAFLEDALAKLGLTRREANEFIVYWLPRMEGNAYNLISFQGTEYTDHARLTVSPQPETVIRVFMAWSPCAAPVDLQEQTLSAPARTGFTLVEWGGAEVSAVD